MSEYVNRLHEYVARFAPSRYQQIEDPETFFRSLNREMVEIEGQMMDAWRAENPPTPDDPMEYLGRSRAYQSLIREQLRQEMLYDQFPAEVDEDGQPLEQETTSA